MEIFNPAVNANGPPADNLLETSFIPDRSNGFGAFAKCAHSRTTFCPLHKFKTKTFSNSSHVRTLKQVLQHIFYFIHSADLLVTVVIAVLLVRCSNER